MFETYIHETHPIVNFSIVRTVGGNLLNGKLNSFKLNSTNYIISDCLNMYETIISKNYRTINQNNIHLDRDYKWN